MPRCILLTILLVVSGTVLDLQAVPRNVKEDYQPIITRNPFDLKPVVEAPKPVETPKPVEPVKKQEVYLTGIASVGYPTFPKKAYIVIRESGTNLYYSLQEAEKKDTLKLVKINDDVKPPTVRVEHNGNEMLLSFKTHGMPASAGAPPAPGGAPGARPGMVPGQPPGIPQPLPGGSPQPTTTSFPQPAGGGSTPASSPANYNGPTINGQPIGVTHIPSRVNRTTPPGVVAAPPPNYPGGGNVPLGAAPPGANYADPAMNNVDVAEQYLRLKLEETRARQQGVPTPPIPVLE